MSFFCFLRDTCRYGCSLRNTQSPTSNSLSLQCWYAYFFILFCTITKLYFNSLRTSYWFPMWSSIAWIFLFPFKGDVMDGWWYPWSARNGDIFYEVWKDVLYHHSTKGNHLNHCVYLSYAKKWRYPSRNLFTISVCSLDWGW